MGRHGQYKDEPYGVEARKIQRIMMDTAQEMRGGPTQCSDDEALRTEEEIHAGMRRTYADLNQRHADAKILDRAGIEPVQQSSGYRGNVRATRSEGKTERS